LTVGLLFFRKSDPMYRDGEVETNERAFVGMATSGDQAALSIKDTNEKMK
jgi:hypothetical protein